MKLSGKKPDSVKAVINGAGAGIAVAKILYRYGIKIFLYAIEME